MRQWVMNPRRTAVPIRRVARLTESSIAKTRNGTRSVSAGDDTDAWSGACRLSGRRIGNGGLPVGWITAMVATSSLSVLAPLKKAHAQHQRGATAQAEALAISVPRPTDESQLLALVIGNAEYATKSLQNPVNDSRAIGEALASLGFDVTALEDANRSEMLSAISSFGSRLGNGGVAVFYYAGHGIQYGQDNFLLPVNHQIESRAAILDGGVPLDSVMHAIGRTSGTNIVILDACRNQPLGSVVDVGQSGLAEPLNAPPGTLIAYATQPNGTADDGVGEHGTYTAAILRNLRAPMSVTDMFQRVRTEVANETDDYQVPWTVDVLKNDNRTGSTFSFAAIPARHEAEALRVIADALGLEETIWPTWSERDGAGRVTAIDLADLGLSGEIPRAIGTLQHLERLDLSGNDFVGAIPGELENLTSLAVLDLNGNGLDHGIPIELGNISSLTSLDLGGNGLGGTIPSELGRLSRLHLLNLRGNGLTGLIPPELGSLLQLRTLDLGANQLTGQIPPELGNLVQLGELYLEGNSLEGTVPSEIGSMHALTYLDLSGNELTGSIPSQLGNLTKLRGLAIGLPFSGGLTGTIPPEIGNLSQLALLDLYGNELTGEIPPELGNLSRLIELDLAGNELTGEIPPELGNLHQLAVLQLSFNRLTGGIPPRLGDLPELAILEVLSNQLTGDIPPELGNLAKLLILDLSGNNLTGTVPSALGKLSQLESLNVEYNELTGGIPPEIDRLPHLVEKNFGEQFPDWNPTSEPVAGAYAAISGTVRTADTNEPITGVEITVTGGKVTNLDGSSKVVTDADGTYTAIVEATDRGDFVVVSPSKASMTFVLPSWTVGASPGMVNADVDFFGFAYATISGSVVDAKGRPVEGVTVMATSMQDATATYSATSDATGTLAINLPAGGYFLSTVNSGAGRAFTIPFPYQTVSVMEGQAVDIGTVREEL